MRAPECFHSWRSMRPSVLSLCLWIKFLDTLQSLCAYSILWKKVPRTQNTRSSQLGNSCVWESWSASPWWCSPLHMFLKIQLSFLTPQRPSWDTRSRVAFGLGSWGIWGATLSCPAQAAQSMWPKWPLTPTPEPPLIWSHRLLWAFFSTHGP